MSDEEKQLERIKRYVRGVLKRAGKYSPEMSYQVELLATDLMVYRELRRDVLEHGVVAVETSREGHRREKVRPSVQMLRQQADAVRADLKSLLMNRELKRDDPGAELGGGLLARLMEGE